MTEDPTDRVTVRPIDDTALEIEIEDGKGRVAWRMFVEPDASEIEVFNYQRQRGLLVQPEAANHVFLKTGTT